MSSGTVERLQQQIKTKHPNLVRLVSVTSHQRRQHLINRIIFQSPQPIDWRIARSSAESMQVRNAYAIPNQLGADRWSALVAAATDHKQPGKAIVILGCGSAITTDFIDQHRCHLGGGISPGYAALQHGLRQATNLHFDQLQQLSRPCPGKSSQQSIEWGIKTMLSGLMNQTLDYCRTQFGDDWQLIVHGGDAPLILPYIGDISNASFCPELVLDGLQYITDDSKNSTSSTQP